MVTKAITVKTDLPKTIVTGIVIRKYKYYRYAYTGIQKYGINPPSSPIYTLIILFSGLVPLSELKLAKYFFFVFLAEHVL